MTEQKVTANPLIDGGDGSILAYYAKGDVAADVFREALTREDPDSAPLQEAPVLHAWWRWVPGPPGTQRHQAWRTGASWSGAESGSSRARASRKTSAATSPLA